MLVAHAGTPGLQLSFGAKGVQTLSYGGVVLEDLSLFSSDAFHIWHLKTTDLAGNVQSGWGESNLGESWNAQTHTETYTFAWGTLATQFVQNGDNLDIVVTETNNPGSGTVLDGAEIYPFALHFPQDPAGFNGYTQYAMTTTGPGVSIADFGSGVVTSVIPNEAIALYGGWKNAGASTYTPIMTSTAPDSLASFLPHNDLPVQPGNSLTYTVSLRFTPEGTPANAADAYASFAATYPSQMTWTDKRIMGTAYLGSSPAGGGDITQPGGFPTNPRRYFNDPSVDITTPSGLQAFQDRMLAYAAGDVANARNLNAQGVITWDIEGEQYPQDTTYVCSPDQIAAVAPEMESTVTDPGSPYVGQKLDDAYFKTLSSAGLRIGLCLRPQRFTLASNGTASQVFLAGNAAIIANLENKARYAYNRWGATIFYVDSVVDANGGTLDPAIFQQLITDLPDLLFIPEESTPRYYAYTAPFYSFLFHTDLGTPASIYNIYPQAFGANLVNDVSASTLATYTPQLTQSVQRGDILMGHADYWQGNDPTLVSIYRAAGVTAPAPHPVAPTITWSAPAAIAYGTALSTAQLNAVASVPGAFTYTPAPGTILGAGSTTLSANFTPSDTTKYTAASAAVNLTVTPAKPTITWAAPASVVAGTALSSTQLNAKASVPGSFTYTPAAGTTLTAGTTQLTAAFTPADTTDYTSATATVALTVTPPQSLALTWNAPAPISAGTPLSPAQLNAQANVPGSFTYTPAAGTVLAIGSYTLTANFTPADTTKYSPAAITRPLIVTPPAPPIQWTTPAPILAGTPLSARQLDAEVNAKGTLTYSPPLGTVLGAGSNTLTVLFTPADSRRYSSASASITLVVMPGASGDLSILSPAPGSTLSGIVSLSAAVQVPLGAGGITLLVDGVPVVPAITAAPYAFTLDTLQLGNGQHTLQLCASDAGGQAMLSATVVVNVTNVVTFA